MKRVHTSVWVALYPDEIHQGWVAALEALDWRVRRRRWNGWDGLQLTGVEAPDHVRSFWVLTFEEVSR